MNNWQRKILFFLPPLLIIGVYFNIIPIGSGIRKKIDSLFHEEKVVVAKVDAIVEKVRGEVLMKERPSFPLVKLVGGEVLKEGASLATGENSSALLSFRGSYVWKVRISSNTQLNIDELMKKKESETTVFNLLRGGVTLMMKNQLATPKKFNIRTKFASFSIRGTTIAVLTDAEERSLVTVHDGVVEAENFKNMDKTLVRDGSTFLVDREGKSKVQLDLDAIDLYDWDTENLDHDFPSMDQVVEKVGGLGPTQDDKEKVNLDLIKNIEQAILDFKKTNEELNRELDILTENAEKSRGGLRDETIIVQKDMKCLETSPFECNLFTEKILLKRGFPRTWGTPHYRAELVADLKKYLSERNDEVSIREEEARILKKLMTRRETVLKAVENDRKNETHLEALLPSLLDERLRR